MHRQAACHATTRPQQSCGSSSGIRKLTLLAAAVLDMAAGWVPFRYPNFGTRHGHRDSDTDAEPDRHAHTEADHHDPCT